MKILINALSGIGDALMFTPAIRLMRKAMPDAEIDALVMFKGVKDMYDRNPDLNNVIHFDFMKEGAFESLRFVLKLRSKYDASVNVYPSNRKEYNVINFLLGAKERAGARYLRKDFANLGWLNNVSVPENDMQHNVLTNIKLCEKLLGTDLGEPPGLNFPLSDDDEKFATDYLTQLGIKEDETVVGIHPGSATLKNHIKRRWEPEKFAGLGIKLIKEKNARVLLFGGPEELELKTNIAKMIGPDSAVVVETQNLPQSAAVMKRCNVFISNDSSLMHISSAMKLNVVAILGPTNQHYIHPWHTDHKIIRLNLECSPCFIYSPRPLICFRNDVKFKCIKELTVDMVFSAAETFLS